MILEDLDVAGIRRWSATVVSVLEEHRAELDELNVFPVPDSDTGANLELTARAAVQRLTEEHCDTAQEALRALAHGAVLGARGNSGVIFAQFLRGLADGSAPDTAVLTARDLQTGLRRGAQYATEAVSSPVEGTILSVAQRAASEALAYPDGDLAQVVDGALAGASEALAQTPEQLPVLARAGVVDAGGRGLVLILQALAAVVTGSAPDTAQARPVARTSQALSMIRERGSAQYGYEVQYLIQAGDEPVAQLRQVLAGLGDSVVVVGTGAGLWSVHVHVNDIGAAIEAGLVAGTPRRITVTRFADQMPAPHEALGDGRGGRSTGIVAVASGTGLAHLFRAEGVSVVDGVEALPSGAQLLAAIRSARTTHVVVLPNSAAALAPTEMAAAEARREGIRVSVVPTRSPLQAMAAIAVHDTGRRFDDDVVAMTEAAIATRWAEVRVAQTQSLTSVGLCAPGDVLGLIGAEVVLIGQSPRRVATSVIDRLVDVGVELVTIVTGSQADPADVQFLLEHLAEVASLVEVSVINGGQSGAPFLIGAE